MLKKYPVISPKGYKFLVTLLEMSDIGGMQIAKCRVYLKEGLFKKRLVYGSGTDGEFRLEHYDYKGIASYGVLQAELILDNERLKSEKREKGLFAFNEWDGKVDED